MKKVVILIDADNIGNIISVREMLNGIRRSSTVICMRAYGNWFHIGAGKAREFTNMGIMPVQTPTGGGPNATDIYLMLDAIDIWHEQKPDKFCILTNDADFAVLAVVLRSRGVEVAFPDLKHTAAVLKEIATDSIPKEPIEPGDDPSPAEKKASRSEKRRPIRRPATQKTSAHQDEQGDDRPGDEINRDKRSQPELTTDLADEWLRRVFDELEVDQGFAVPASFIGSWLSENSCPYKMKSLLKKGTLAARGVNDKKYGLMIVRQLP
ncbi:MAG: NYN domain-containing protein [Negativicutes bacterium]|nr:NYN domain-containing protein [Negativicutes bacterium]